MQYRNLLTVVAALGILAAGSSSARADNTVQFGFWYSQLSRVNRPQLHLRVRLS
jgi:hypothetical protein